MAENFQLISVAFQHGGEIPPRHTCEGDDISPPLQWENAPHATRSLALIVDDPDAPDPQSPKKTWVHWVLYNLPPELPSLEEGLQELPQGARAGVNDWSEASYGGPCPPLGNHRYFFKLYALDTVLPDLHHPTKHKLEHAMRGHILAEATLMGTYQKRKVDLRMLQTEPEDRPLP